ncbi:MAG TPA: hypothetical protein DEG17_07635 [Cyanobacteria bacterium UBA11149]|nr:hypothetical protein [Cyanobacteria bacterium UBA11367]HBE57435.1 hypothetical protein [Cyanobacteria bacterium UBA11366]HBK62833.1 hypothetical protein [Cyanobacteria bacterium UBA11166]HBR73086.1 hypothetical protein [Cyanobacteria bacterium UBA11159]HBS72676.1 hypothetical protein [Cyanobacteria bacterium UBA11153]HBW88733.1 hypothetical protein [Cyanobacteria bacterium UBA11149]HCA95169.1 hypothetical protein [Cyanobacteria bacterium UBA9226]
MSNNCQTLEVADNHTSENVSILEASLAQVELDCVEFRISGVGTGFFTYFQNYDDGENKEPTCLPLESVIWNGKNLDLTGFTEQSVCCEGVKLIGLNLLGKNWEIIFDLAINIDGVKVVGEVTYHPVETPIYSNPVRELVTC